MVFSAPATTHILVVEDDHENGRLFSVMLTSAGYTVTHKTTVRDAVEILQSQPVSLVLVDWYLPDGTAAIVCDEVQRQKRATPQKRAIPVILITGQADLRTIQIENSHFDRWLSKPTTAQKLLTAVQQLLEPQSPSPPE